MTELTTRAATGSSASGGAAGPDKITKVSPDEAAALFADARRVVIVPGTGWRCPTHIIRSGTSPTSSSRGGSR